MSLTVTLADMHPTTTLHAITPVCKGFTFHRHHQELPYPASEHFLPNQASILTSFGKKCSFFNCEPCITGRSAQSLAAARFAAEIKLQIAELWTAAGKNGRRDRLAGLQAGRLTGWQAGRLAGWQVGRCSYRTVAGWIVSLDRVAGGQLRLSDSFTQECPNR